MNDTPQNELLSAYLDEELAPAERAEVERMLEENDASRQLLEELRALRTAVQSLPRERLEPEFSKHVMQLAERTMLAGSPATGQTAQTSQAIRSEAEIRPTERPVGLAHDLKKNWRERLVRPLSFAALAIAAALSIMFLQPAQINDQGSRGDIARSENVDEVAPAIGPALRSSGLAKDDSAIDSSPASRRPPGTMYKSKGGRGRSQVAMETESELIPNATPDSVFEQAEPLMDGVDVSTNGHAFNSIRSKQLVEQQLRVQSAAAPPVYSIQLDITPEAVRSRTLDKTLLRNNITFASSTSGGESKDLEDDVEQTATRAISPIDVVYVEMTQSQLESVLTDIADQPAYFSNIMVPASPAFAGQKNDPFAFGGGGGAFDGLSRDVPRMAPNQAEGRAAFAKPKPNDVERGAVAQGKQGEPSSGPETMQGLAQRVQLPQLSNTWEMRSQATEEAQMKSASGPRLEQSKAGAYGEQQKSIFGLDGDGNISEATVERPGEEQMFRALFILRVVPATVETTMPAESPAPHNSDDHAKPDTEEP